MRTIEATERRAHAARATATAISSRGLQAALACAVLLALFATYGSSATAGPAPAREAAYDLLIRNGTVIDGSGRPGSRADVAIRGDRIVAVGDLAHARGRLEIDATGRYVTPGFINVHDHTEPGMHGRPVGLLTQGITTAISNADGYGPLEILAPLGEEVPGINYGGYIGFNSVWAAVVGTADRRPSADELQRMRGLIAAGLRDGAFGVSAGLDYKPGYWATQDEVVAVVEAARGWRTKFPNHERLRSIHGDSSLVGMAETIAIGERAGLKPVITHMKMLARDVGRVEEAFDMFAASAARGVPVGIDTYPYTFAATDLDQILVPAWAQQGGRPELLERLADPELRARIAADTDEIVAGRIRGAANIYLPELGRELTDIAAEWGVSPGSAIARLLAEGRTRVMLRSGTEQDLQRIMRDPLTAISCDCGAISIRDGHPRNWGNYPLFLGRYVREMGLVDWPEAIRKMTALPAAMIGLAERGYLVPGMYADVTVFDPAKIVDRATIREPTLESVGIDAVVVNGRVAWRNGRFEPGAGRALRRGPSEPTRAMNRGESRGLSGRAVIGTRARVRAEVAQADGAARPVGRLRVDQLPGGRRFEFTEFGIVQSAPGWTSVTGVGRWNDGRTAAATLYAESAAPFAGGKPGALLRVDGEVVLAGPVAAGHLELEGLAPGIAR